MEPACSSFPLVRVIKVESSIAGCYRDLKRVRIYVRGDSPTSDSGFDPISTADGLDLMEVDKGGTTVSLQRDFAFSLVAKTRASLFT